MQGSHISVGLHPCMAPVGCGPAGSRVAAGPPKPPRPPVWVPETQQACRRNTQTTPAAGLGARDATGWPPEHPNHPGRRFGCPRRNWLAAGGRRWVPRRNWNTQTTPAAGLGARDATDLPPEHPNHPGRRFGCPRRNWLAAGGRRFGAVPRQAVMDRADAGSGHGRFVSPIRNSSMDAAAARPSAMAHTINDCPRPASPATNTPGTPLA
jgi:hypothetical protein